jgi:hypothetical protein
MAVATAGLFLPAFGADYPFPSIAHLPERNLIGADKNGYPHIEGKNKGEVARIATSLQSPSELRSLAIWGLAISGYSPESADALLKIATDGTREGRETAAMGLRNFTTELPAYKRNEFRTRLREGVKLEGTSTVDEIVRTLIAWDDAPWIAEQFGSELAGHAMEIEILRRLPAGRAVPRLLEIYHTTRRDNSKDSYGQRADVGRALADLRDARGIDILDTLLDVASVPTYEGVPSQQYRQNVFAFIQRAVGDQFGYERRVYDPSIDEAIVRFREWWLQERYHFVFPTR